MKQKGNALIFILIAIALLGLLTVTLSRSGDSTNETGSFEQNQILASEILSYAKSIENAVQMLLARGCSENDISFENNIVAGYTNPNSPADKSCHVFDVAGAGMTYEDPSDSLLNQSQSSFTNYGEIIFVNLIAVQNVGSDCGTRKCTELVFNLPYIKEEICQSINKLLSISTQDSDIFDQIVNYSYGDTSKYQGVFQFSSASNTSTIGNGLASDTFPAGKASGCIYRYDLNMLNNPYEFYHVLHAR